MGSQAMGILEHGVGGMRRLASPPAPPPAAPAPLALGGELRGQRLGLVALYSLGIGAFGIAWCAAYLLWDPVRAETDWAQVGVMVPPAILGGAGWWALYRCRRGQLRRATYTNVAALILAATANLAFIRNAEGAAVVTYAVAVSLAALVIEGRRVAVVGRHLRPSPPRWRARSRSFPVVAQVGAAAGAGAGALLSPRRSVEPCPWACSGCSAATSTPRTERAWALARESRRRQPPRASERAPQLNSAPSSCRRRTPS